LLLDVFAKWWAEEENRRKGLLSYLTVLIINHHFLRAIWIVSISL